jgi:DNA-binding transcriptional regulator YiaG
MNKETRVYGLACTCHPEAGFRYIGKTVQPGRRRLRAHIQNAANGFSQPVYRWIRKHGAASIVSVTLSIHPDTVSGNLAEIAAIQRHKTHHLVGGLNVTLGGDGGTGFKHSAETRARMSAARTGVPQDPVIVERRVAAIRAGRGYSATGERLAAMNRANVGKKLSGDHLSHIRQARQLKRGSNNPLAKLTELQVREIKELLQLKMTQREIALKYNVSPSNIASINQGRSWSWVVVVVSRN